MENNTLFGNLPTNWRLEPLYKLTSSIKRGRQPKYSERSDSIPVINQKMIRNRSIDYQYVKYHDRNKNISEEAFVCKNDILINSTGVGTVGRSVFISDELKQATFADSHVTIVRPDNNLVNPRYLSIVLSSAPYSRFLEETLAQGSTGQVELSRKKLQELEVPIPSEKTQQIIAYTFEGIDEKIMLNQQINSNLLKLTSNLVMEASLRAERITDLRTLIDSDRKANISIDEISLDTYVSNTSLRANKRGLDTAEDYPSVKTVRAVEPGDILVGNIRPYFKKIWFADRKGGASNDVITFRADNIAVTPEFLFGILYSDRFFDYVTATSKGTKMPRGDKQAIALYQVGLPDKDVIASVTDEVKPMLEQVSHNERQNQQLTKLRNLLLPKLLAGDVDLSNIETVMNNA